MVVSEAGVDTWSPSWYVNPDGPAADWLRERGTVRGPRGSVMLPEPVGGHRVGWFPGGLVFAEGHPDPAGLCRAAELPGRGLELQESLLALGMPLPLRERPFPTLGATSEGLAGLRRVDATVNLKMTSRAEGLAVLAGVAALLRDSPGKSEVFYGSDRGVETVYLRGHAGKRVLGRWYDKSLEASTGPRGTILRVEDQRRWAKDSRRQVEEVTSASLRSGLQRRFYTLWQASKGVRVAGSAVVYERLVEATEAGDITPRQAEALAGHVALASVRGRRGAGVSRSTMYNRERLARELGLVVADGVLEEVEVDLGEVLEAVMDTDAWDRTG
jgi:hypothetical protein